MGKRFCPPARKTQAQLFWQVGVISGQEEYPCEPFYECY
jgi:hypothetical protein